MKCNIDDKGRRVRRTGGIVCCVAGVALVIVFLAAHFSYATLLVGLGLIAGGMFQLFEARKGWCALRAMGVKTRV
jgi:uncharacterized membrane protein HdeD (DUF308 family)